MKKFAISAMLALCTIAAGARDKNFHIFLCFGQSNMEGNARIEQVDKENIPSNYVMMAAVDDPNLGRTKGNWYPAVPPLCRPDTGLTPADYFGRTMAESLPAGHKVGVINVSVAGCKIECFMPDMVDDYYETGADWLKRIIDIYDHDPYNYMLSLAKEAQKQGVISGILLHQGESDTGNTAWLYRTMSIYYRLLDDLGLKADECPLLVGEVVNSDRGGTCADHNPVMQLLPTVLPQAHVISSANCKENFDRLHFSAAGYRELGRRYAAEMLRCMGYPAAADKVSVDYSVEPIVMHAVPAFRGPAQMANRPQRPQMVTFNVSAPGAREVLFESEFSKGAQVMKKNSEGTWSITLSADKPGTYNFNYIIDGRKSASQSVVFAAPKSE